MSTRRETPLLVGCVAARRPPVRLEHGGFGGYTRSRSTTELGLEGK